MESEFGMGKGQVKPHIARRWYDFSLIVMSAGSLMDGPTLAPFAVSLGREVCRTCLNAMPLPIHHQSAVSAEAVKNKIPLVYILELWEVRIFTSTIYQS